MRNLTVKRLVWIGIITGAIELATGFPIHLWSINVYGAQALFAVIAEFMDVFALVPVAAFTAALAVAAVRRYLAVLIEHDRGPLGFARPARQLAWAIAAAALGIAVDVISVLIYNALTSNEQLVNGSSPDYSGPLALQNAFSVLSAVLFTAAGIFLAITFILSVLANDSRRAYASRVSESTSPLDSDHPTAAADSGVGDAPIHLWWARISPAARTWLMTNNGDALSDDIARLIVAAGGTVHYERSETSESAEQAFLSDDEMEWIAGVPSARTIR